MASSAGGMVFCPAALCGIDACIPRSPGSESAQGRGPTWSQHPRFAAGMSLEEAAAASAEAFREEIILEEPLQFQRQELRALLDEWGKRHTAELLQALKSALASTSEDKARAPFLSQVPSGISVTGAAFSKTMSREARGPFITQGPSNISIARDRSPTMNSDSKAASGYTKELLPLFESPHSQECMKRHVFKADTDKPRTNTSGLSGSSTKSSNMMRRCAVIHQPLEILCVTAIVANALLIGFMSDSEIKSPLYEVPDWMLYAELGFIAFFTLECAVRVLAHGAGFFCTVDWRWNLFDVVLVVHGLLEGCSYLYYGTMTISSYLSVLRLARLLRLLRVIRFLRPFRGLRLMIHSIRGSARNFVWGFLFLSGFTYVFAVVFVQASAEFLRSAAPPADEEERLRKYWGSLRISMTTLYMVSTGGEDWSYVAAPLSSVGGWLYSLFVVYIGLFLFMVTNAITSVCVEATMSRASQDDIMTISFELEKKDKHVEKLRDLFRALGADKDGLISYEDFCRSLGNAEMHAAASSLGIDAYDAPALFKSLCGDLDGALDLETFVIGCMKLSGEAKATDLYYLINQQRQLAREVARMVQLSEDRSQLVVPPPPRRRSSRAETVS